MYSLYVYRSCSNAYAGCGSVTYGQESVACEGYQYHNFIEGSMRLPLASVSVGETTFNVHGNSLDFADYNRASIRIPKVADGFQN